MDLTKRRVEKATEGTAFKRWLRRRWHKQWMVLMVLTWLLRLLQRLVSCLPACLLGGPLCWLGVGGGDVFWAARTQLEPVSACSIGVSRVGCSFWIVHFIYTAGGTRM